MARKHDYESWDTTRYSGNKCKFGHEGQIAKVSGLCVGCHHEALDRGGFDWRSIPSALDSVTKPQELRYTGYVPVSKGETVVVNRKFEPFDVYIGRPSKWGNPFSHRLGAFFAATREEAIARYEEWIHTQPQLLESLHELEGKRLGCWCKPLPCHGDVLERLSEARRHEDTDRVRGKVILVCGSRKWADKEAIRRELASIEDVELVIHGSAPGADILGGEVAHELGIPVREFPADWERYKPAMEYDPYTGKKKGNPAGPIRNQKMLREGQPDLVLAFTDELTGGTGHMVGIARKAGVEVRVYGLEVVC